MRSLVYFSSSSENTHRFVQKLGIPAIRIPLLGRDSTIRVDDPYVLILPTYGGGSHGAGEPSGAVPKQVIKFLNDVRNRSLIAGVIAAGNTNFGEAYCLAGDIISAKCQVPYLYRFELMGTAEDVIAVREGLGSFWRQRLQPNRQSESSGLR